MRKLFSRWLLLELLLLELLLGLLELLRLLELLLSLELELWTGGGGDDDDRAQKQSRIGQIMLFKSFCLTWRSLSQLGLFLITVIINTCSNQRRHKEESCHKNWFDFNSLVEREKNVAKQAEADRNCK